MMGGSGMMGELMEQWEAAAQQLVAQLNARSNSLFPAVLSSVASATPANDHSSVQMVVAVKRGGKDEIYNVAGARRADHKWLLTEAQQQHPTAT